MFLEITLVQSLVHQAGFRQDPFFVLLVSFLYGVTWCCLLSPQEGHVTCAHLALPQVGTTKPAVCEAWAVTEKQK